MNRFVLGAMLTVATILGFAIPAWAADDPFAEESVWEGVRYFGADKKTKQDWKLTITERKKNEFKGTISFDVDGKEQEFKVSGTAPQKADGAVNFKSEKKGFFSQTFTGNIKSGEIALTFNGTNVSGGKAMGTATLKTKK